MNHNKKPKYSALRWLPAAVAATVAGGMLFSAIAARPKARSWDDAARQRKAEYVFLSGYQAIASDSMGGGMNMLAYAARLNPDDPALTGNLAMATALVFDLDSADAEANYLVIKNAWEHDPSDYFMGNSLSGMADKLGKYSDVVEIWQTLDSLYPARTEPAANLAEAYLRRYIYGNDIADYNRAMDMFNRIESEGGKDVSVSAQKIRLMMLRNDTAAVDSELNSMLAAMPRDVTALLLTGLINQQFGRDSLTLSYLNRAAAMDSTDGRTYQQLANYYRNHNDSAAYSNQVFRALESGNLDFDVKQQIMRGYVTELYEDSTQWPRIEKLFGIMERMHSDEPEMHHLYGLFEMSCGNVNNAREQFGYAVALDPANDGARQLLVGADFQADSLDAVIRDARPGLELFPDNFYYPVAISAALTQKKDYQQAIDILRSVDLSDVKNKKAAGNVLTTLGDTYQHAGMTDSAMAVYERAIAMDRENYMAYNNSAYFMAVADRDLDRAERYASYAIAAEPENSTYLDTYAWVKFKQRDYKDAKTYIDRALTYALQENMVDTVVEVDEIIEPDLSEELPDSLVDITDTVTVADSVAPLDLVNDRSADEALGAEMLEHAGDIYYMCGFPDEAVILWERAIALKPEDNDLLARKIKARAYLYK